MAAVNGDWDRDHVADANPDLRRKRQRLSQEAETSPQSSDESVVIESLPVDDYGSGHDINTAIELHDDNDMALFSSTLTLDPDSPPATPIFQINFLLDSVANHWPRPLYFDNLSHWLLSHVQDLKGDLDGSGSCARYLDDVEFFGRLGSLCYSICQRPANLFTDSDANEYGLQALSVSFDAFITAATVLGSQLLQCLPNIIDSAVARRDSAQTAKKRQAVESLIWLSVLAQILALHRAVQLTTYCHTALGYKPKTKAEDLIRPLSASPSLVPTLTQLLQRLAQHHRDIENAWQAIDAVLRLLDVLDLGDSKDIENMLTTINMVTLPVVCGKHPGSLPDDFHGTLVAVAQGLLRNLTQNADMQGLTDLYRQYIQSDFDALLVKHQDDKDVATLLHDVSEGSRANLVALIETAWTLHAYRSYMFSTVMEVRTHGIHFLGGQLLRIHNDYRTTTRSFDHPVAQYAARFLHKNELIKYIFGPKSHTSLVKQSHRMVGYLAATHEYTNLDTDIIWDSCMGHSVEASFAKAAFAILMDISKFLKFDQLLYLAKKYTTTDPADLGQDAVDSLTEIFQRLQAQIEANIEAGTDKSHLLDTAFISIEIMMRVDDTERTVVSDQLKDTAKLELFRFAKITNYEAQDRKLILERCVPEIKNHSKYATTSIEIVAMFMQECGAIVEETRELLSLLPLEPMVEELAHYVTTQRAVVDNPVNMDLRGMGVRIDLFVRLFSLTAGDTNHAVLKSFFDYTAGTLAINNEAREHAWQLMGMMGASASKLLNLWRGEYLVKLPVDLTTPGLVASLSLFLQQWAFRVAAAQQNYSQLLTFIPWHKLLEIAETPSSISKMAQDAICHLLFDVPKNYPDKTSVTACHANFAKLHIRSVCDEYAKTSDKPGEVHTSCIMDKINLLQSVLVRSQEHSSWYNQTQAPDVNLSKGPKDETTCYAIELPGNRNGQAQIVRAHADSATKTSELVAKLPAITGADDHRIIVAGREIGQERADSPLSDLGVQASGVISICPRYNIHSDLGKVLTMPGAVEQQILEHYDKLEAVLDASGPVASKMTDILARILTPPHIRGKLSSTKYSASDLFPVRSMWRSIFYIDTLHRLLKDLARLGVADEAFVRHGVTLLVHCLSDDARPRQDDVDLRAMCVLTAFLQEQPTTTTSPTLIEHPAQFSSYIYRVLNNTFTLPPEQSDTRYSMTMSALGLLQECSRRQPTVWQSFTEDPGVADLHARVILGSDLTLSNMATKSIKDFCDDPDTSGAIGDFYMVTTLSILPQALGNSACAKCYFELATRLLLTNFALRNDETRARTIAEQLLSTLWNYTPIESADLPVLDVVITGLIGLISGSFSVLRSFKKPLRLQGLAAQLFSHFLFNDDASHQLFHRHSRNIMYELVKAACDTKDDFSKLLETMSRALQAAAANPHERYPGLKGHLRPPTQCSGLVNLGQTCYMNSLLQQLYANVPFRQFILDTPTNEPEQQKLLRQVKELFSWMQNSARPVADTRPIATELCTDVNSQEDVHDFYANLLNKLEKEMPQQARPAFKKFYTGKMISQVKGICGHVSPRTEEFVDMPIVVKNKRTLAEALDELVQGEPMQGDNQYKCISCQPNEGGKLVDAMKRNCPDAIPDNLTFCLKRFEYDVFAGHEVKVNDRFEFPEEIDLSKYHRKHLDNPGADLDMDVFELVGVIVHLGSNGFGHYWSYTLLQDAANPEMNTWVRLEDRNVTTCEDGFAQVARECFGGCSTSAGLEATDNAYVLFYRRKTAPMAKLIAAAVARDPETQALLPARVPLPNDFEDTIRGNNVWLHRMAHLFDEQLSGLLEWVLAQCKHRDFVAQMTPFNSPAISSDAGSLDEPANQTVEKQDTAIDEITLLLSRVATTFIMRIAPCDPTPVKKLKIEINGLCALFDDQPKLAGCVLRDLTGSDWFGQILGHSNDRVRLTIINFVWNCVAIVRQHDPASHGEIMGRLRDLHASVMSDPKVDWTTYLPFASGMAEISPADTAAVLDKGYWSWVFEMLALPWNKATQNKFQGPVNHLAVEQMSALYEFIAQLLTHHLTVSHTETYSPENGCHLVCDEKVLLRNSELQLLGRKSDGSDIFTWIRTSRFADFNRSWTDFTPGLVLDVLIARYQLSSALLDNLIEHIEIEEEQFGSVVNLALHFCANAPSEADAIRVFTAVGKVAPQWRECEGELLQIIPAAFMAIPRIVLMTLEIWVFPFLTNKAKMVRRPTAAFLKEHVFDADADLTQPDLVAVRARLAARLTREGAPIMKRAYDAEQPRNRYESLIEVYRVIQPYLQSLRDRVGEHLQRGGKSSVSQLLLAEHDRALQTLKDLDKLSTLLEDWESESTQSLPSGAVRSMEEESEDYGSDDMSADWDSGSDLT